MHVGNPQPPQLMGAPSDPRAHNPCSIIWLWVSLPTSDHGCSDTNTCPPAGKSAHAVDVTISAKSNNNDANNWRLSPQNIVRIAGQRQTGRATHLLNAQLGERIHHRRGVGPARRWIEREVPVCSGRRNMSTL